MEEKELSYEELIEKYNELGNKYKELLDNFIDLKNNQKKRTKLINKLASENKELNLLLQAKLGRYLNKIKKENKSERKTENI